MEAETSSSNENIDKNDNGLNDHLVHLIILQISKLWTQFKTSSNSILRDIGAYNTLDALARQSAKHPYIAGGVFLAIAAFALPFLILLVFALSTVVMTFTGFILIEGTLITIASILLFGCLGAVLIVFLFFGGITLAGYFGFLHIYDLYNGLNNKTALINFMNKERTKGN